MLGLLTLLRLLGQLCLLSAASLLQLLFEARRAFGRLLHTIRSKSHLCLKSLCLDRHAFQVLVDVVHVVPAKSRTELDGSEAVDARLGRSLRATRLFVWWGAVHAW